MPSADIQIKRHVGRLMEEETQRLVEDVAGLIVCFLKKRPVADRRLAKKKVPKEHSLSAQATRDSADEDH